jgi:hypothetical protein
MDAHVHIYPFYDLPRFLLSALDRMPRLAPTDQRVLCLAERSGHTFFQSLAQDEISLPSDVWRIVAWDPDGGVKIRHRPTHRDLWILSGRQMATRENIEICSLFSDFPVPDGLPARDTLRAVRDEAGGLPALDWAFGKWLFARGKLVRALLAENAPADLLLIDTAMRPRGTPPPSVYAAALREGRPVLAGSDPLSAPSEETLAGAYGVTFRIPVPGDPGSMVVPLRAALRESPPPSFTLFGTRNTLLQALSRRRAAARHAPAPPAS